MAFTHIAYIVNPASKNGKTATLWPKLEKILPSGKAAYFTEGPGQAIQLAQQLAQTGVEVIASVGGDGTLSEVVTGLMQLPKEKRPILLTVPCGTGGDFRKTLGIPARPEELVPIIEKGRSKWIDLGSVQYQNHQGERESRYFSNVCSFGLSGVVDHAVNHTSKKLGGKISFLWGTIKGLLQYKNVEVEVSLDNQNFARHTIMFFAVCNGKMFGGGMKLCPAARPDDGQFHVINWQGLRTYQKWTQMWRIYSGSHLQLDSVQQHLATQVEARSSQTVWIDVDGEALGSLPVQIQIHPQAVRCVIP